MAQETQIAGLTAFQLARLCLAEQIERTMHLLFSLNHWAKARERLFFADRQGLYQVKAAIVRQAYEAGHLIAHAYVDGKASFGKELAFDLAADTAAEGIIWRLEEFFASPSTPTHDMYDRMARQFYAKMTGREIRSADDRKRLEEEQIQEYILAQLRELEREARATCQPIPRARLMELCIAPGDLLAIEGRRYYDLGDWDSWDRLDDSDLRKLDPEGLSLVAFQYASRTSHYTFHLPFRLAEAFVPTWLIDQLKCAPWSSREHGEYYGRAVTEAESLQQPITDILLELSVDISAICPRQLLDKQEHMLAQALRYAAWCEEQDFYADEDEDDDAVFWQEDYTPRQRKSQPSTTQRAPDECPFCLTSIPATGAARLNHWQQEHPGQDLTFSQVSWVMDQIRTPGQITSKKQFYQEYPPDYREPHEKGLGTRYWRIETLAGWVNGRERCNRD